MNCRMCGAKLAVAANDEISEAAAIDGVSPADMPASLFGRLYWYQRRMEVLRKMEFSEDVLMAMARVAERIKVLDGLIQAV